MRVVDEPARQAAEWRFHPNLSPPCRAFSRTTICSTRTSRADVTPMTAGSNAVVSGAIFNPQPVVRPVGNSVAHCGFGDRYWVDSNFRVLPGLAEELTPGAVGVATMRQPRSTPLPISSSSIWLYPSLSGNASRDDQSRPWAAVGRVVSYYSVRHVTPGSGAITSACWATTKVSGTA
jgi:hypothetical protein